ELDEKVSPRESLDELLGLGAGAGDHPGPAHHPGPARAHHHPSHHLGHAPGPTRARRTIAAAHAAYGSTHLRAVSGHPFSHAPAPPSATLGFGGRSSAVKDRHRAAGEVVVGASLLAG